ncbi:MAG: DUF6166 domain-containing protein [Sulfurimonas sp.]
MNNHVFKGHKSLLGSKFVTYGEVELPSRYEIFSKSKSGFDWGNGGSGAIQLAFSMLFQLSNKDIAVRNATEYTMDVVRYLNSRDWIVTAFDVLDWLEKHDEIVEEKPVFKIARKAGDNIEESAYEIPVINIREMQIEEEDEEIPFKIKLIKAEDRTERTETIEEIQKRFEQITKERIQEIEPTIEIQKVEEVNFEPKTEETIQEIEPIKEIQEVEEVKLEPKIQEIVQETEPIEEIQKIEEVEEEIKTEQKRPVQLDLLVLTHPERQSKKEKSDDKTNVVKNVCQELNITQKQLAEILEVPEGTVSSWAVKDEIPRLGKKAIEFYAMNTKNQKIVDSFKNFMQLLDIS